MGRLRYDATLLERADGGPGRWRVAAPGHPTVVWAGFATGPEVLSPAELDRLARLLLGVGLPDVAAAAAEAVVSFVAGEGPPPPALLLHSATSTTKGFEGDLTDVQAGRHAYDVPGYLEARVVALAAPGDLAVGRAAPWREAVELGGVDHVDIGDLDRYYLSQAMLLAAEAYLAAGGAAEPAEPAEPGGAVGPAGPADPRVAGTARIVAWLRAHPDAVVRIYALDTELQILLTWLRRAAGLPRIRIDANNPIVSHRWNQKNHIHPDTAVAAGLTGAAGLRGYPVLALEQAAGDGARRLGLPGPALPGYTLRRAGDPAAFVATARAAADLLRRRHGITRGCLKPSEAGDGARIVAGLDLLDLAELDREVARAWHHGDDYLLEANVEFVTFAAAGRTFLLSPSGHIRGGHVAPGLTAQLMNGRAWEGNAYVDADTAGDVGLTPELYAGIRASLVGIRDAFYGPRAVAEGCHAGLVTGGIDYAVGRVGGFYGDEVLAAAIDFNLSSHGAEYLRAFLDQVRPEGYRYAATRVYRPTAAATLATTREAVLAAAPPGQRVTAVAAVPGSWGMVGCTGPDTLTAVGNALALVAVLAERGLAQPPSD